MPRSFRDLALRSPTRLDQTHGLRLEFLAEPAMRLAHEMLLLPSEKLPSVARQVHVTLATRLNGKTAAETIAAITAVFRCVAPACALR
jgi:hypothetical protein